MKKLVALILVFFGAPLIACADKLDTLSIQITMVRGERSKDTNSARTTITISGQTLLYKKSYTGRRGGTPAEQKQFRLTKNDVRKLVELIKNRGLLVKETIERPQAQSGMYFYFELSIESALNGKEGAISIKGPRKAIDIKDERLYKDSIALIEAIYGMMRRTDKDVVYEPLIN